MRPGRVAWQLLCVPAGHHSSSVSLEATKTIELRGQREQLPQLKVKLPRSLPNRISGIDPAENSNTSDNQGRLVFPHANGVESQSAYMCKDGSERDQAL